MPNSNTGSMEPSQFNAVSSTEYSATLSFESTGCRKDSGRKTERSRQCQREVRPCWIAIAFSRFALHARDRRPDGSRISTMRHPQGMPAWETEGPTDVGAVDMFSSLTD